MKRVEKLKPVYETRKSQVSKELTSLDLGTFLLQYFLLIASLAMRMNHFGSLWFVDIGIISSKLSHF